MTTSRRRRLADAALARALGAPRALGTNGTLTGGSTLKPSVHTLHRADVILPAVG